MYGQILHCSMHQLSNSRTYCTINIFYCHINCRVDVSFDYKIFLLQYHSYISIAVSSKIIICTVSQQHECADLLPFSRQEHTKTSILIFLSLLMYYRTEIMTWEQQEIEKTVEECRRINPFIFARMSMCTWKKGFARQVTVSIRNMKPDSRVQIQVYSVIFILY